MVALASLTDAELYGRGTETLVASWEAYARGAPDAAVLRLPGVVAAVFPEAPERDVYNNAVLEAQLPGSHRSDAIDAMEAAYAAAGVGRFAAWVHESDEPMRIDLERRAYALDTTMHAMGMALADLRVPRPALELVSTDWFEYLHVFGLPPNLLARADHSAFHLLVASLGGEQAASAMAFDHRADCGIYNVETLAHARRRGLATALTALHLHEAIARGCRTASLQATAAAQRIYAALGFRDLGAILEYVR